MWRVPSSGRVYNHLKAHGEELAVLVSRFEEADLVDRLPLLVEKDEAALNLLVEHAAGVGHPRVVHFVITTWGNAIQRTLARPSYGVYTNGRLGAVGSSRPALLPILERTVGPPVG